jgi:gamma-glutamylcyclotransferase (GGCT)/AIG2-like uncharacterized protein YtfP
MVYYFAYGSNMSRSRLRHRLPSARSVGIARLTEHQLRFHKVGHCDGSAKCDAYLTGDSGHQVIGVLYQISLEEKPCLDEVEGVGDGYEEKRVAVETDEGDIIEVFTYHATLINPDIKPYDWYRQHVLIGAREHDLPETYIDEILRIPTIDDPDTARQARELAIYSRAK